MDKLHTVLSKISLTPTKWAIGILSSLTLLLSASTILLSIQNQQLNQLSTQLTTGHSDNSISTTSPNIPFQIPVTKWEVYSDHQYNYSIKYPVGSKLEYTSGRVNGLYLLLPFDDYSALNIHYFPDTNLAQLSQFYSQYSIDPDQPDWVRDTNEIFKHYLTPVESREITVEGKKTNQYVVGVGFGVIATRTAFQTNKGVIEIHHTRGIMDDPESYSQQLYDEIVSSFKYTEPPDITSWATHTTPEYSIQHPPDWNTETITSYTGPGGGYDVEGGSKITNNNRPDSFIEIHILSGERWERCTVQFQTMVINSISKEVCIENNEYANEQTWALMKPFQKGGQDYSFKGHAIKGTGDEFIVPAILSSFKLSN